MKIMWRVSIAVRCCSKKKRRTAANRVNTPYTDCMTYLRLDTRYSAPANFTGTNINTVLYSGSQLCVALSRAQSRGTVMCLVSHNHVMDQVPHVVYPPFVDAATSDITPNDGHPNNNDTTNPGGADKSNNGSGSQNDTQNSNKNNNGNNSGDNNNATKIQAITAVTTTTTTKTTTDGPSSTKLVMARASYDV